MFTNPRAARICKVTHMRKHACNGCQELTANGTLSTRRPNVSCAIGCAELPSGCTRSGTFERDSVDRMGVATSCNVQPNVPSTRSVKLNVERPMQVLRTMVPLKTLSELCPPELDFVRVHVSPRRRLDMKTVGAYQVNIPASNLVKHGMGNGFPSMHPSPSTS